MTSRKVVQDMKKEMIYGEALVRITLFGSYARGDFTDESDIDIFVIVDLAEDELIRFRKAMVHLTFETNLEYDIDIEPVIMSLEEYCRWVETHPLLKDVQKDGVSLYEAA